MALKVLRFLLAPLNIITKKKPNATADVAIMVELTYTADSTCGYKKKNPCKL